MMRTWILGAAGVVVGVLLVVWAVASRFPALNGDTSKPPKLFHEPYNGLEFSYPATWADVKGEHGIVDYKGARGCEISIFGFGTEAAKIPQDLEQLRKDLARDDPHAQFGARPAWAGTPTPLGSFVMTTDKGKSRQADWETVFENAGEFVIVSEIMQEGDQGCHTDLLAFERSFRLFPRDTRQK